MSKIKAEKYIGMTNTMKCGMKATIIAYRGCADIDIQFEDGTIRTNMTTKMYCDIGILHLKKMNVSVNLWIKK